MGNICTVKDLFAKVLHHPLVVHLRVAIERYNDRSGPQFAAAITYFSALSLVPISMFSFALLGLTVSVLRPELMGQLTQWVRTQLGDSAMGGNITSVIEEALNSWSSIGPIAIIAAIYAGSNWVANLKRAVRVMWSNRFQEATKTSGFIAELVGNVLIFLGLIVCLGVGVVLTQLGSSFSQAVLGFLGWSQIPGISFLWSLLTFVLLLISCFLLMLFIFTVLPHQPVQAKTRLIGTAVAAVLLAVLLSLAGRLVALFASNAAAAVFGPVIVLMLLLNIFATLILVVAAWVGCADTVPTADLCSEPARPAAAEIPQTSVANATQQGYIREETAIRGAKAGWYLGYGVGAATGAGVGALIVATARLLGRLRNRQR